MTLQHYRGAHGALIVYDVTKRVTFEHVKNWMDKLMNYTNVDPSKLTIMMVGNKSDLTNLRTVSTEEAKDFAEKNGLLFLETSALEDSFVEDAFLQLISRIYELNYSSDVSSVHLDDDDRVDLRDLDDSVKVGGYDDSPQNKGCNC